MKEVLIHRVPLVDGGISPQKKKRKHRHDISPVFTLVLKLHLVLLLHFKFSHLIRHEMFESKHVVLFVFNVAGYGQRFS